MKLNKFFISASIAAGLFILSSAAFAAPGANLLYNETDLGGGLWQYDYTFYNTSTNSEYLYNVDLLFDQTATVTGLPLPTGWNSTVWEGENETDFIVTFSTGSSYDIAAGSFLSGFSFTIDYLAGDTSYNAYFDDYIGGTYNTSGFTSIVPEPVSSILFAIGGSTLGFRRYWKKRRNI
jgi:hypothetical protein